jgi:octaprenyl-diphosphate synthase
LNSSPAGLPQISCRCFARKRSLFRDARSLTLRYGIWSDHPALKNANAVEQDASLSTLVQMFEPIRADLVKVEAEFYRHVESQVDLIPKIGRYIQNGGGKRIRPAVLLMAARLTGYTGELAVLYAAVVEFIHTATLVHDDIIDNSKWRRGQPSVHSRWGSDVTVLLGDFLYIKSMGLALTPDRLDIVRQLCDVTLRMIEGELYQLSKKGDVTITEEEHLDIVRRKTAYLFGGCARIGGMIGNATPEQIHALEQYGISLGMAFQLIDDLLDFSGDQTALGKPIGGDLGDGKVTLPIIRLLQRSDPAVTQLVASIVHDHNVTPEQWREICRLLQETRSVEYAMDKAREQAAFAKTQLYAFPASHERDALMALPDYILARDR